MCVLGTCTKPLHARVGSLADDDTVSLHRVHVVLQTKICGHTVCEHAVVGVPGWTLERFQPGEEGGRHTHGTSVHVHMAVILLDDA